MKLRQIEGFRSKKELVYETLRQEILDGSLPPSTRLVIDDLAAQLGVSQIPVREALQQLQADGYVVIQPHVGAKVTELHTDSIHEIFALLESLEVIAGQAACQHMSDEAISEAEALVREMDTLTDNREAWSQANMRFHRFIAEFSDTFLVTTLLAKVFDHWDRLRRHYLKDVSTHRLNEAQKEHWAIIDALRAGDAERLEQVTQQHNQKALRAYLAHLGTAKAADVKAQREVSEVVSSG